MYFDKDVEKLKIAYESYITFLGSELALTNISDIERQRIVKKCKRLRDDISKIIFEISKK